MVAHWVLDPLGAGAKRYCAAGAPGLALWVPDSLRALADPQNASGAPVVPPPPHNEAGDYGDDTAPLQPLESFRITEMVQMQFAWMLLGKQCAIQTSLIGY